MHFEYSCKSNVTIVFFSPVTSILIPCTILRAEYNVDQSVGDLGINGNP